MNVLVLIAGVVDPNGLLALDPGSDEIVATSAMRRLGPFDESALETALALRDEDPTTRIDVVVCGGPQCDPLVRTAASHRVNRTCRLDCASAWLWDARLLSGALMPIIDSPGAMPDLVLLGREFGDRDDGLFAPFLAEAWGWRHAGMVQRVRVEDGAWSFGRSRGGFDELLHYPAPVLASVTNDRSNRLRHPLMKNVVAAKRASIEVLSVRMPEEGAERVRMIEARGMEPPARAAGAARRLRGSEAADLDELARILSPWRRKA